MRDWFLPLAPMIVVGYFFAFPAHLSIVATLFAWVQRVVH